MSLDFSILFDQYAYILTGLSNTLKFAFFSAIGGFCLGTLIALAKLSKFKILKLICNFYTSIFRGTPLLVQLSLVYLALPQVLGIRLDATQAGILTFTLNSAAYISETLRGGIGAIDKGQYEASKALGISYFDMMKDIIIPQAIRHILPGLVNECIALVKESSLLAYIGVMDLMRSAEQITVITYRYFEPYLCVAAIYYVIVLILTFISKQLERKLCND